MDLPFEDQSFGAYIANLSLMIVPNKQKQISEAYRVLKPGSAACFAIWGREENCQQFTTIIKALKNLGRDLPSHGF